jgi:predicted Zn-dependent protease
MRAAYGILLLLFGALVLGAEHSALASSGRVTVEQRHTTVSSGTIARALSAIAPSRSHDDEDRAALRRRIRSAQAGTYITDILAERDSSLSRWPDRHGVPLSVWIQPTANIDDFTTTFVARVRQAFLEWSALNLPVQFTFVDDSTDADVHVAWIDRFKEPISGRTRWSRDDDWWIIDANITLAVHHSSGELLDEDSMRAMALHEIGHLLGLDHTHDSMSVMAPKVRVRLLSDADRATARLIYALPAGPLR